VSAARFVLAQGTETFTNAPAVSSAYSATATWTGDNGLSWTTTDFRTDVNINGRAMTIRNGSIVSNGIPNGIGNLSFSHKYSFSGSGGILEVRINGNLVGSVNPTQTLQTASFPNINIIGSFNLEIRQTVSGNRIGVDDITWTGYSGLPCTAPAAQPTSLVFNTVTQNSITASFTNAATVPDQYLVLMSTDNALTDLPVDGTSYSPDDVLGNALVVAKGNSTSFTVNSLTPNTTYYFYIFSLNGTNCSGGPLYLTASPLTGNTTTQAPPVCAAPATAPGSISFTPASTSIAGNFGAASGADGYLVVISNSAALGATPVNGTSYTPGTAFGSGTVLKFGAGNSFSATGLTPNTTYYFYVFAVSNFTCTGGPLYNTTSSNGSVATTNNSSGEPAGYYNAAAGKNCGELKTALAGIITSGHSPKSYGDLWDQYLSTDTRPNPAGAGNVIWDMYAFKPNGTANYYYTPGGDQCGQYNSEADCYNREHSFPSSWFNDASPMVSDYNHIFPTDGYVNNRRSNYKYGKVATATYTSTNGSKLGSSAIAGISGPVFEPIDEYKGDFARAYLYMVTRYENNLSAWRGYSTEGAATFTSTAFPGVQIDYLRMMLSWCRLDPVSAKEVARNNGTYSFQGNRNPYIDHPEYVEMVWNNTCIGLSTLPVDILLFTGKLSGDNIVLNWEVENEVNLARYEIERGYNGTSFTKVGEVAAQGLSRYGFSDPVAASRGRRVYYRLKKTDNDNRFVYSNTFSLHIPAFDRFSAYPNPAQDVVYLQLNNTINDKAMVQVTDIAGRIVMDQQSVLENGLITLPVSQLNNGLYMVRITWKGTQYLQKLIIEKRK